MFNFEFDKKAVIIVIAIMLIAWISSMGTGELLTALLSVPGVIIAMTFHEFAHAFAADKLGDDTPRREGRISLNPLAHIDPIGFVMLLFAGFGWGKPVNVNPRNYNRDISMEKADAIVSVAGPIMNFLLALVFGIIYMAIFKICGIAVLSNTVASIIMQMMLYVITINIGLGVFNLIPLPPLDGSKVIKPILPAKAKAFFENNEYYFYILFVILWITGIAGTIISPIINIVFKGLVNLLSLIFRV